MAFILLEIVRVNTFGLIASTSSFVILHNLAIYVSQYMLRFNRRMENSFFFARTEKPFLFYKMYILNKKVLSL